MLHCINVTGIIICYWYGEATIRNFFLNPSEAVTSYILCKVHQPKLSPELNLVAAQFLASEWYLNNTGDTLSSSPRH